MNVIEYNRSTQVDFSWYTHLLHVVPQGVNVREVGEGRIDDMLSSLPANPIEPGNHTASPHPHLWVIAGLHSMLELSHHRLPSLLQGLGRSLADEVVLDAEGDDPLVDRHPRVGQR